MTDTLLFVIIAAIAALIGMVLTILIDLRVTNRQLSPRTYFAENWWRIGLGYLGVTGIFFWILYIPFQLTYFGH